MSKLTTVPHKDKYTHFYWNGHDITGMWMDFFSGLSMKEEKHCEWIFAKRYTKELDKLYPPKQLTKGVYKTMKDAKNIEKLDAVADLIYDTLFLVGSDDARLDPNSVYTLAVIFMDMLEAERKLVKSRLKESMKK